MVNQFKNTRSKHHLYADIQNKDKNKHQSIIKQIDEEFDFDLEML